MLVKKKVKSKKHSLLVQKKVKENIVGSKKVKKHTSKKKVKKR